MLAHLKIVYENNQQFILAPLLPGGIFSWRFIAMFSLNQLSFQIKFYSVHVNGEIYIANMLCVSSFGVFLSLCSIRAATGSWKKVFKLALKFPPLLVLPSFAFVTFGSTPAGEVAHIL